MSVNSGSSSPHKSKSDAFTRFNNFRKRHPILMNLFYIILTGVVLVWVLLMFVDSWTLHGDSRQVPSVKGLSLGSATAMLHSDDLSVEVMDSVFDSGHNPGSVVEQTPHAGSKVKPGRTVYLTIAAFSPKMVTVPDFRNVSARQGQSMFEGLGLKSVRVVNVPSEYKDLVLGVKYNGVPISPGARIPVTSSVTIEVGTGYAGMQPDEELDLMIEESITSDENID